MIDVIGKVLFLAGSTDSNILFLTVWLFFKAAYNLLHYREIKSGTSYFPGIEQR